MAAGLRLIRTPIRGNIISVLPAPVTARRETERRGRPDCGD